jgi:hypothetical protein
MNKVYETTFMAFVLLQKSNWLPCFSAYMDKHIELHVLYVCTRACHTYSVISGPCHHNMAHPRVVGGGDSLQMWMVAANMLNTQS